MVSHPNHPHPLTPISDTRSLYPDYDGQWQCDICELSYNNQHHPYHCALCKFDLCLECFQPKKHPMHTPSHDLYNTLMVNVYPQYGGEWKCDGCHQQKHPINGKTGYHCFLDQFDLCKSCFHGHKYPIHIHPLKPANARIIYDNAPGLWVCDVCKRSGNDMHTEYSWHCEQCEFDACNECLTFRATIPDHPHPLQITDAREAYPQYGGSWQCDICRRNYQPNSADDTGKPYHCAQCEYDVCSNCIASRIGNRFYHGRDVAGPPASAFQFARREGSKPLHPHMPPQGLMDDPDDTKYDNLDDSEKCIVCINRPKNATIVHGHTGHICCCLPCAYILERRGDPCPICRAPIDRVIKQYLS